MNWEKTSLKLTVSSLLKISKIKVKVIITYHSPRMKTDYQNLIEPGLRIVTSKVIAVNRGSNHLYHVSSQKIFPNIDYHVTSALICDLLPCSAQLTSKYSLGIVTSTPT